MNEESEELRRLKGPIAWMAKNGVAAKMMIVVIMVGGVISLFTLKKEVFPEFSADIITIGVSYRGAAPEEVENAVSVRVEEAINGIDGISKIRSSSRIPVGLVTLISVR